MGLWIAFLHGNLMWATYFKFLSKVIPSRASPSLSLVRSDRMLNAALSLFCPKISRWHLFSLSFIWLFTKHLEIFMSSISSLSIIYSGYYLLKKGWCHFFERTRITLVPLTTVNRSFMYMLKRRDSKTVPWGTPNFTSFQAL